MAFQQSDRFSGIAPGLLGTHLFAAAAELFEKSTRTPKACLAGGGLGTVVQQNGGDLHCNVPDFGKRSGSNRKIEPPIRIAGTGGGKCCCRTRVHGGVSSERGFGSRPTWPFPCDKAHKPWGFSISAVKKWRAGWKCVRIDGRSCGTKNNAQKATGARSSGVSRLCT